MGYYTHYTLTVVSGPHKYKEDVVVETIREFDDYAAWALHEDGDDTKWYSHYEDMLKYSKLFPEDVLMVHGEGEESGDIWWEFFKNGEGYHVDVEYIVPVFDENQLE